MKLPSEIILHVLSFLPSYHITRVSRTCIMFYNYLLDCINKTPPITRESIKKHINNKTKLRHLQSYICYPYLVLIYNIHNDVYYKQLIKGFDRVFISQNIELFRNLHGYPTIKPTLKYEGHLLCKNYDSELSIHDLCNITRVYGARRVLSSILYCNCKRGLSLCSGCNTIFILEQYGSISVQNYLNTNKNPCYDYSKYLIMYFFCQPRCRKHNRSKAYCFIDDETCLMK